MPWKFLRAVAEDDPLDIRGVNVWSRAWRSVPDVWAEVRDPLYGQAYRFRSGKLTRTALRFVLPPVSFPAECGDFTLKREEWTQAVIALVRAGTAQSLSPRAGFKRHSKLRGTSCQTRHFNPGGERNRKYRASPVRNWKAHAPVAPKTDHWGLRSTPALRVIIQPNGHPTATTTTQTNACGETD